MAIKKVIWKKVNGYQKDYEVSNKGDVRVPILNKKGKKIGYKPIAVHYDKFNMPRVTLRINGTREGIRIHRLVAELFVKKPKNAIRVKILGSKPEPENIQWVVAKEKRNKKVGRYIYIEDGKEKGIYMSLHGVARDSKYSYEKIKEVYNGFTKIKGVKVISL